MLISDKGYGIVLISPGPIFTRQYCADNDDQPMEKVLDQLNAMRAHNCLIVLNKHLNKKPDLTGAERVGGAGAWVNSSRQTLALAYDKQDDVRLMETCKVNSAAYAITANVQTTASPTVMRPRLHHATSAVAIVVLPAPPLPPSTSKPLSMMYGGNSHVRSWGVKPTKV